MSNRKIGGVFLTFFLLSIAFLIVGIIHPFFYFIAFIIFLIINIFLFMESQQQGYKPSILVSIYILIWKKIWMCLIYPLTFPYHAGKWIGGRVSRSLFGENPKETFEKFLSSVETALQRNDYTLLPFIKSEAVLLQMEKIFWDYKFENYEKTNIFVYFKGDVYAIFLKGEPVFILTYFYYNEISMENIILKQTQKIRKLKQLKIPSELML